MRVDKLIEELQKLPKYASVRVPKKDVDNFEYIGFVEKVILQPRDDDDNYDEIYVDIK